MWGAMHVSSCRWRYESFYLIQERVGAQRAEMLHPVQHGRNAHMLEDLGHEAGVVEHLPKQCPAQWPELHHILHSIELPQNAQDCPSSTPYNETLHVILCAVCC